MLAIKSLTALGQLVQMLSEKEVTASRQQDFEYGPTCQVLNTGRLARAWGMAPSIHMPRWACRILLGITDMRVARLLDIGQRNAMAEKFHSVLLRADA